MQCEPGWLNRLAKVICECIDLHDDAPPVGCHYHFDGFRWEVSIFVMATEVVGGPLDGKRISSLFFLDLMRIMTSLDVVESSEWQPHRVDEADELGAHVSITGEFEGQRVWLRILASSPERFQSGQWTSCSVMGQGDNWTQ